MLVGIIYLYICKYIYIYLTLMHCAARLAPQRWMVLPAYAGPNGRDVWMEEQRMLDT